MIPADGRGTSPGEGTARAAVASAWRAAWRRDMGVSASAPEGPAHPGHRGPGPRCRITVIRPLRLAPPGARHRAGTATS